LKLCNLETLLHEVAQPFIRRSERYGCLDSPDASA
jgi:hypothetical protein